MVKKVFLFAIFFGFCANVLAQIQINQNIFYSGIPVSFRNCLTRSPVILSVNGTQKAVVTAGETVTLRFGRGLGLTTPYSEEIHITAEACRCGIKRPGAEPPAWSRDEVFLDKLAITDEFIAKLDEKSVKTRVDGIVKFLENKKPIYTKSYPRNYKDMIAQIKIWRKSALETTKPENLDCDHPIAIQGVHLTLNYGNLNSGYRAAYSYDIIHSEEGYVIVRNTR